jgi:hypothetical protein
MREGRRAATVGMEKESNIPRNAARGGCERKMQNRIGQLLKDLQCILNLHFADGDPDGVAAGDGLTQLSFHPFFIHTFKFVICDKFFILHPDR